MEAGGATERLGESRLPAWVLGVLPLALIAAAITVFALLGAPGLGDRNGVPVEEITVERTELVPGEIQLTVRNDGPDAVDIAQISVNDAYVDFSSETQNLGRLASTTFTIPYDWIEGEAYEVFLLTSTGGTVVHPIESAAETPAADSGFFALMALLGIYVGVIPVALGMLWLPFVRRIDRKWLRLFMALTIGLLVFLAIDALLEGVDIAATGSQAFGGAGLVFLGALSAYVVLSGIDGYFKRRSAKAKTTGAAGSYVSLLIATGIGLHNFGEGLAIGSSYAVGALALGAFLVVGFAIHNTTEGFAIVAPLANDPPGPGRLALLGLIAGGPAILGAIIGASAFNTSLAAFMLGVGAGAIAQVVQTLLPSIRDERGKAIDPLSAAGFMAGLVIMFGTGLLVSV